MADERMIKILLSMGVDEAGARRALEQFQKFQKSLADLEKEAQMVKKAISIALSAGEDTKELEQELERIEAVMREVRKQGAGGFGSAFDEQAQAAQKTREELEKASAAQAQMARDSRDNAYHLRDIGEKLSRVGQYARNVGNAILSPLTQASQLFLSTAAQSDPLVIRWKSEMAEIQDAWLRIGRVASEEMLPFLERAADLLTRLADFVEENPELIKIALISGGVLRGIGEGLQSVGSLVMLLGSLKHLGWIGGAAAGGAGSAITGGSLMAALPLLGIPLGLGGYEAIARSQWGQQQGLANLGQYASVMAYGLGKLFGGEETGQRWFQQMGEMTGVLERQASAAERASRALNDQLEAFSDYEDARAQRERYERESEEARRTIVAEFAERRAELERSYEERRNQLVSQYASQRAQAMRAFAAEERRAEQDYYRQRAAAARQHGLEIERAEENHRREIQRLQRDHNRRVQELVDERDAFGLLREQQRYEDQRRDAEEDYRIEMRRRAEDYAIQLRDMEAAFAVQRQRRLEDFHERLIEMQNQHARQMVELRKQHADELKRLERANRDKLNQYDRAYRAELELLRRAEQNRLNILRAVALNDQRALEQAGAAMTSRYRAWLMQQAQSLSFPSVPRREFGGWVNSQTAYLVGERGPELFVPSTGGQIVPTHRALNIVGGNGLGRAQDGVALRIETSSLTLQQVIQEIDRRLARNNRALVEALS